MSSKSAWLVFLCLCSRAFSLISWMDHVSVFSTPTDLELSLPRTGLLLSFLTKRNCVTLAQNMAKDDLHPKREFTSSMDEDIFVTKGFRGAASPLSIGE